MSKVDPNRPKTGGRQRGTPNRATADVRQAIAVFAEANVHRLQEWLDRIADEDPAKAADIFVRLLEYHVPKLARSEIEVRPRVHRPLAELSIQELQALIAEEDAKTGALTAAPQSVAHGDDLTSNARLSYVQIGSPI
jgi:hypothetical protein